MLHSNLENQINPLENTSNELEDFICNIFKPTKKIFTITKICKVEESTKEEKDLKQINIQKLNIFDLDTNKNQFLRKKIPFIIKKKKNLKKMINS